MCVYLQRACIGCKEGTVFSFFPSCFSGKSLSDVEKSWFLLERAEHERERALQEALLLLENLEQLAQKFRRKVAEPEVFCYIPNQKGIKSPRQYLPFVCGTMFLRHRLKLSCLCLTGSAEGELSGGHSAPDPQAGRPRPLHPGGGSGGASASGGAGCRRPGPRAPVRRPERHGQEHREGKLPQQRPHRQEVRGDAADRQSWIVTGKHQGGKII